MKRTILALLIVSSLVSSSSIAFSRTLNEADTDMCETMKLALINSLRAPIDEAITNIYKNDQAAPSNLTWASYDTEIIKIKQVYGIGGDYEITLKVTPFYDAHNSYGEDMVTVSDKGKLLYYKHLKTYQKVEFD